MLRKNNFSDRWRGGGFTLTEVLIYAGVFTVVSGLMVGVFTSVSRVQTRESAKTEVAQQGQFVMNAIKQAVSQSSYIDIANDTPVSTLTIKTESSATDPIVIYLENGIVYRTEAGGTPVPLSNQKVSFSALSFTKTSNPPGPDVVKVDFTVAYNTEDAGSILSRSFRSAIARVSAVTFDSDLLPSSDNTYNVGASNPRWLNGYFSGNLDVDGLLYVGASSSDPSGANGAIYYNTTSNVFRGYANGAWANLGSGGSSQWTTTGSDIYYSTGNVGIGTDTISTWADLHVNGDMRVGDDITAESLMFNSYNDGTGDKFLTTNSAFEIWHDITTDLLRISGKATGTIDSAVGFSEQDIVLTSAGNVGINKLNPSERLDVNGNLKISAGGEIKIEPNNPSSGSTWHVLADNLDNFYITESYSGGSATRLVVQGAGQMIGGGLVLYNSGFLSFDDATPEYTLDLGAGSFGTSGTVYASTTVSEIPLFQFTMASTSPEWISGGLVPFPPKKDAFRITQFACSVDGGTSVVANVTDGTNDTETITCDADGQQDTSVTSNNTFTAMEDSYLEMGAITGSVDYLSFTVYGFIIP